MKKKLEAGDIPLFDFDNKELIKFAYNSKNPLLVQTVNSEMIRRLIITTGNFNKISSRYTRKIIWLTITLAILAFIQIVILLLPLFTQA